MNYVFLKNYLFVSYFGCKDKNYLLYMQIISRIFTHNRKTPSIYIRMQRPQQRIKRMGWLYGLIGTANYTNYSNFVP